MFYNYKAGCFSRYLARLGDLNLDDAVSDRATPIDVPVEKAIPHESYNAAQHTVDIALVRLKDRVEFTSEYMMFTAEVKIEVLK